MSLMPDIGRYWPRPVIYHMAMLAWRVLFDGREIISIVMSDIH